MSARSRGLAVALVSLLTLSAVAQEGTRLTGTALHEHVFSEATAVGVDHAWGANWKVRQHADGRRTMSWKSSPLMHGVTEGKADVVADRICITYRALRSYSDVCSAVYWRGGRRYELWREGKLAETYYRGDE